MTEPKSKCDLKKKQLQGLQRFFPFFWTFNVLRSHMLDTHDNLCLSAWLGSHSRETMTPYNTSHGTYIYSLCF